MLAAPVLPVVGEVEVCGFLCHCVRPLVRAEALQEEAGMTSQGFPDMLGVLLLPFNGWSGSMQLFASWVCFALLACWLICLLARCSLWCTWFVCPSNAPSMAVQYRLA